MTPERERAIERLCEAALACPPPARKAWLADACGADEELRHAIEALLALEDGAAGFLETPALDVAARQAGNNPALAVGAQLGPYSILSSLGAGSMGEVYRARDESLGRDVAVKVLPTLFNVDHDRLARFEREARILAALNHPNIATIHGVERVAGTPALILELVDGETLEDRLARLAERRAGGLAVDEALSIARQLALAVEAAHEKGVVHRDLKPANIKIRVDGVVKVLDFGLAKALQASDPDRGGQIEPSSLVASSDGYSGYGVVLGTAPYMSPEQAEGRPIDSRADIWAFGTVLYEMLTGQRAFPGATTDEILRQVASTEPSTEPDWTLLSPTLPPAVRSLLRRCLQKDSARRLRHITDARFQIEEALEPPVPSASTGTAGARLSAARLAFLASALVVFLAGVWLVWPAAPTSVPSTVRFEIRVPVPLPSPIARRMAISPDGQRLAYVGGGQLWVRRLGDLAPVGLRGTDGSMGEPFFSPDGEWVAYFSLRGLQKVLVSGGAPVPIAENAGRALGGSWGAEGTIVLADGVALFRVGEDGGPMQVLARPAAERGEVRFAWPQVLPNRGGVLMTILRDELAKADIAILDPATGVSRVIVRGGHAARYVSTGHLVYAQAGRLQVLRLDPTTLEARGEAMTIASVELAQTVGAFTADFDVSRTGTLVYAPAAPADLRTMVWVDRDGREESLAAPPNSYVYPRISPDGSRIALDIAGANRDIWVWSLERQVLTRIADGPTEDLMPAWSADGQRIFFASDVGGLFGVYARAADGSGQAERIVDGPENYMPFSAPDRDQPRPAPAARAG